MMVNLANRHVLHDANNRIMYYDLRMNNFQLNHIASLCKYTGISFIAGAITHGFFSGERQFWTATIGIAIYLLSGILEKIANPEKTYLDQPACNWHYCFYWSRFFYRRLTTFPRLTGQKLLGSSHWFCHVTFCDVFDGR